MNEFEGRLLEQPPYTNEQAHTDAFYRRLVENAPDIIFRYDLCPEGHFSYVSPAVISVLGYLPDEFYSDPGLILKSVHGDDIRLLRRYLQTDQALPARMIRWFRRDGGMIHLSIKVGPVRNESGVVVAVEGIARDVSTTIESEAALRESEERYRTLVEAMGDDAILIIDMEGRTEYGNIAAARMLGLTDRELSGTSIEDVFPVSIAKDFRRRIARVLQTGVPHRFELRLRQNERDTWTHVSLAPLKDKQGSITAVLAIGRDVTDLVAMREELRALSLVDELTGLYNRRGFSLLAEQQLRLAERSGKSVSILLGDLDGLKAINDEFGHREGDAALVAIARILKETCRDSDVVGRLGGDEFAVLAAGAASPGSVSLATRLQEAVSEWNSTGDHAYRLAVSVGIATLQPEESETLESIMARADALMYEEKRFKRSQRTNLA